MKTCRNCRGEETLIKVDRTSGKAIKSSCPCGYKAAIKLCKGMSLKDVM